MKKYLVPFDGSELATSALQYAISFARTLPGVIDIVYIVDERALANPIIDLAVLTLQGLGTLGDFIPREKAKLELKAKLIAHGEELLEKIKVSPQLSSEDEKPVEFTTSVVSDNPLRYLIEVSENHDAIFMGLYGQGHQYKMGLWGSTSEAVIRKGMCPVFLASSDFNPLASIIVGFDNRPKSRQALAWAAMLGESMKLPVTVITCGSEIEWIEKTIKEAEDISGSYHTDFKFGQSRKNAAIAILDESADRTDMLICLGAFGDQPMRELFLGSVAEEVITRTKSPVMLFK